MRSGGKIKKLFVKAVAVLNTVEGIVHLIVASIGFWGCFDLRIFDFRLLLPNIENFVFGLFSILTGIIMSKIGSNMKVGLQDQDRTYTNNERQLDTLIDCWPGQLTAAYQKPVFEKILQINL
jgi:hypothetical protein